MYYDPEYDNFYFKLNNEWTKLTFKKDFFGNWDAETVDVPENELPNKLKNEEESSQDSDPVDSLPGGGGAEIMIMI